MEEFEESIIVETANDGRIEHHVHHDQPEEVVIILPDESCFEYAGSKKVRHEGGNKVTWTKEQTHMLIDEYKNNREELENPTGTKSAIWDKIAEKFNEKWNTNFSADICANKWRSMKNTYKRVRYSQRPEHSKKRWEYYDALSEVYKNVKLAKPTSRMLSSEQQAVHIVQFAPQSSSSVGRSYSPIRLCSEPTSFNIESEGSEPPSWFREFIQEYHRSEDVKLKILQQIHKDIVRFGERQCFALEKLSEELKN